MSITAVITYKQLSARIRCRVSNMLKKPYLTVLHLKINYIQYRNLTHEFDVIQCEKYTGVINTCVFNHDLHPNITISLCGHYSNSFSDGKNKYINRMVYIT